MYYLEILIYTQNTNIGNESISYLFFSPQCYSLSGTTCDGPLGESHHHAHHSHHSHHHGGSAVATAHHAHNSHGVASVVSNKNNRRKVSLPYNPCPTSHW